MSTVSLSSPRALIKIKVLTNALTKIAQAESGNWKEVAKNFKFDYSTTPLKFLVKSKFSSNFLP